MSTDGNSSVAESVMAILLHESSSLQRLQHGRVEGTGGVAAADVARPVGIGDQCASDRDEVELGSLEPFADLVDIRGGGALAVEVGEEVAVGEADGPDGDGRLAGDLLRPAGEVE